MVSTFTKAIFKFVTTTKSLFYYFKRRYSGSQVRDLNNLVRLRGKVRCCRNRILLLEGCLNSGVAPKDVVMRITKSRARHTLDMEKAFMLDDVCKVEGKMRFLQDCLKRDTLKVKQFLTKFDFVRFCSYLSNIQSKKDTELHNERLEMITRLKKQRYGQVSASSHVTNLSSYKLSQIEMDVLSKGLKFAIPPTKVKREEIFTEFESLWSQLEHLTAVDTEAVMACKTKLSDIAQAYCGTHIDAKGFSLTKEHYTAIKRLRENKDIVICKPDKGSGVVILDRVDYESKMFAILNDRTKFTKLGNLPEYDRTSAIEKSLQKLLSNLKDSNQITEKFYKCVRPTGSERPRMYGLPKVHKQGTPLRPILSMIKSTQHTLAKELSLILEPVLKKFSSRVIKDSFLFVDQLKDLNFDDTRGITMCSFDIVSLFTNVPLEETIQICVDTLYNTDLTPPDMSQDAFEELILCATKGIEFSFCDSVYKQIDGVAMGSPLGPILANIFVGYHESKLLARTDVEEPLWYGRYVDDTFGLFWGKDKAHEFLNLLNSVHPSLQYTCEFEDNNTLSFLDVLVHKHKHKFLTSVFRKATFTGLYTRYDSFTSMQRKVSLVKCLVHRVKKISSEEYLQDDMNELRSILRLNGYPDNLLTRLFQKVNNEELKQYGPKKCPVFLKLPWIGTNGNSLIKRVKTVTEKTFPACQLNCIFKQRTMLPPSPKESLPAHSSSLVIYEFKCECDARYVGRTTQRLADRIKQHVPATIRNKANPKRKQPKRQCRDLTSQVITCDSAIGKHLLSNTECAAAYTDNNFRILAKCRSLFQLKIMEAIYIKTLSPILCRQKEFVFKMALF